MDFLKDNWLGLIGVVGTAFSIGAFFQAMSAARSAHNASAQIDIVKRKLAKRNIAEELANVRRSVERGIWLLEHDETPSACEVLQPTLNEMGLVASRRGREIDSQQSQDLDKASSLLRKALGGLSPVGGSPALDHTVCVKNVKGALQLLVRCQGTALAAVDDL